MGEPVPAYQEALAFAGLARSLQLAFEVRELDVGDAILARFLPALESAPLVGDARGGVYSGGEVGHAEGHEHHAKAPGILTLRVVFDQAPCRKAQQNHAPCDPGGRGKLLLPDRLRGRSRQQRVEQLSVVDECIAAGDLALLGDRLCGCRRFVVGAFLVVWSRVLRACPHRRSGDAEQSECQNRGGDEAHGRGRWIAARLPVANQGLRRPLRYFSWALLSES